MDHVMMHEAFQFGRNALTTRRDLLRAGGLGLLGLGLPGGGAVASGSAAERAGRGRAKACIFLFMWGGPSQLDTFDMKPLAPAEVRGEFQPIATRVPGWQVCEHFTGLAQRADRCAVIRSLHHDDPAHLSSGHATLTGQWAPVLKSDQDPPSDRDTPVLGSLMSRLRPAQRELPGSVMLPWKAYHPAAPGGEAPGQHGGWIGPAYDPLLVTGDPNAADWRVPALRLADGLSAEQLASRDDLRALLDRQRRTLEQTHAMRTWNSHQQRALQLLISPRVAAAFDLSREPAAVRERYGRNIHGQAVLLARRLIEHDVPVVHVNWHNDGRNFWDTHGDNFNRLKRDLIPPADRALSALLDDLQERGLLEETIVCWVGEFGRRPQITPNQAGREHWPQCYSGLLAGGGIRGGMIYGASDKHAAYPVESPVSPRDYMATVLHALGVDYRETLLDREGRPHRICDGRAMENLFI